jgi:hypothetical protein
MSHDCFNVLSLRHPSQAKLDDALAVYKSKRKLLEYLCPQPELDVRIDIDEPTWREQLIRVSERNITKPAKVHFSLLGTWRKAYWGPDRDIYFPEGYSVSHGALRLQFCTASCPPLRAYDAAIENHGFQIEACYDDGAGSCGRYIPQENIDDWFKYDPDADLPLNVKEIFAQFASTLQVAFPI